MALIVEDGSVVTGANSYVSLDDVRTYATARGLTVPAADADLEILIIKAFDYLEGKLFKGEKLLYDQATEFPRNYLYVRGILTDNDKVPLKVFKAQCELAVIANTNELFPTSDGREVIKEVVDVVEVEYSPTGASVSIPRFTAVDNLLKEYLSKGNGMIATIRA